VQDNIFNPPPPPPPNPTPLLPPSKRRWVGKGCMHVLGLASLSQLFPPHTRTVCLQAGFGFRRRLAQQQIAFTDNKVALWVLIKFTGSQEPVVTAVEVIDSDPCKISGFCSTIQNVDVLQVTSGQINTTDLVLTLNGYTPGRLRFSTAYVENGVEITNAAFLMRTNRAEANRGGLGACTSSVTGNTRLWDCEVFIPAGDTIVLSVTVPNTLDPAKPITKTLDVVGPGGCGGEGKGGCNGVVA